MNFTIKHLTKKATKSLEPVDKLIAHFAKFGGGRKEITLGKKIWDDLEELLAKKSKGKESLTSHEYRGYSLTRG